MISNSYYTGPNNDVGPHITAFDRCMDGSIKSYPHFTTVFYGDDFKTHDPNGPMYTVGKDALRLNPLELEVM